MTTWNEIILRVNGLQSCMIQIGIIKAIDISTIKKYNLRNKGVKKYGEKNQCIKFV